MAQNLPTLLGSCLDLDLSGPNSEKPPGARRKMPDAGGFQQFWLSVLQTGRIEQCVDGGGLAPLWGKKIAGYEMLCEGWGWN